jgi:RND family efflux transporter MFP subunit
MKSIGLSLLLLLTACSSGAVEDQAAEPIALVKLVPASAESLTQRAVVYGAADSGAAVERDLSPSVEAILASIDAPVGTHVAQGQIVARLKPSPASQLALTKARSDVAAANAAFARARRLRADGLVSNAEVETARAAAVAADATSASMKMAGLVLRSPAAGTVSTISGAVGDVIAAGTAVAKISVAGTGRARFGIDPALARSIVTGAIVRVVPLGGKGGFSASVSSVDPVVDPQTRLASLYATIPLGVRIGPGEPLKGELDVGQAGNALSIAYSGLLDDGGQPYVYVVAKGVAHRRDVVPGPESGDRIAILRGVMPGELIVTEGGTALEDGMKVRTR